MPLSSVYAGRCPFDRRSDWCCGGQSLPWLLVRASSLLCGCRCPVGSWVCSLAVGVEAPRSISELWRVVDGIGALALGEEPELLPHECALLCHLSPVLPPYKVHCCWHCPGPHLNLGNASNRPWCPPGIVSTGPPAQINQGQVPGPHSSLIWSTAEATKAAQPRPQVHMPTKPVTAEATPVPAMDTPSVYSEVLPALNL